jgi:hypothetical protein
MEVSDMATAKDIIAKAKEFIGTKEIPANSNNVCFNTMYYGRPVSGAAYPWCCAFIWCIFQLCGAAELFYDGQKTALCAALANWFKQEKRFYKSNPQAGDIVFFKFGAGGNWTNHVGLVESVNADGSVNTIEGNTSTGNDCNGGAVMRRIRRSGIMGYGRPAYDNCTGATSDYPTLRVGSKGAMVTMLQQRLTSAGYGCGKIDGIFGTKTLEAVKAYQAEHGLTVDGVVGAKTWRSLIG